MGISHEDAYEESDVEQAFQTREACESSYVASSGTSEEETEQETDCKFGKCVVGSLFMNCPPILKRMSFGEAKDRLIALRERSLRSPSGGAKIDSKDREAIEVILQTVGVRFLYPEGNESNLSYPIQGRK